MWKMKVAFAGFLRFSPFITCIFVENIGIYSMYSQFQQIFQHLFSRISLFRNVLLSEKCFPLFKILSTVPCSEIRREQPPVFHRNSAGFLFAAHSIQLFRSPYYYYEIYYSI